MSVSTKALLPGQNDNGQQTTLGVMGGGQLGRMFVHSAQQMGYFTAVLDPDVSSPAGWVSHYHIETDYLDQDGLAQLMQRSVAITTEFENVPAPALYTLGGHRTVAPSAKSVAIAQHRVKEKTHFKNCGVACAPFQAIESQEQLRLAMSHTDWFPAILKTSSMGYDGKGQVTVVSPDDLAAAWNSLKNADAILEKKLDLAFECSVIVVRGFDGQMVHFPVQKNLHRNGILAVTEVYENAIHPEIADKAVHSAKAIAQGLDYVGVLCLEFFVLANGELVVNEMAPRPHNSGHYTMNACDVSQFDLQVRSLARLPLVQPRQHSPAIMLNILGDLWFKNSAETAKTPAWAEVLALPGCHLHLYGKLEARKARKMGHLNITAATTDQVKQVALRACEILGIEAF